MHLSCQAIRRLAIAGAVLLGLTADAAAHSADSEPLLFSEGVESSHTTELWEHWQDPDYARTDWTIDYRFRTLFSSCTSYEFGTPEQPPDGWSPLSRLDFPINSSWHGLEIGVRRPTWAIHGEWLMPQQGIHGELADFDWMVPDEPFTDLGLAQQRWIEGQMADLGGEFQLCEQCCGLPIEIWPTGGFRWQRFDIVAYDALQVKWDGQWHDPPYFMPGDVLTFNQQYYVGYVGGQLRTTLRSEMLPPLSLRLQGDWGRTQAYNIDHHLLRDGDRFTMENTSGNSWHIGLIAEMLMSERLSLGFQIDHMEIRTTGTHRLLNVPLEQDMTWDNGVSVSSDQTSFAAFVRVRL